MSQYGGKEMANAFRTVRKNTVQIAEDIPEDQYDFVAAPGVQSVSELLRHVAFAPTMYEDMHRERRVTTPNPNGRACSQSDGMGSKRRAEESLDGSRQPAGRRSPP